MVAEETVKPNVFAVRTLRMKYYLAVEPEKLRE